MWEYLLLQFKLVIATCYLSLSFLSRRRAADKENSWRVTLNINFRAKITIQKKHATLRRRALGLWSKSCRSLFLLHYCQNWREPRLLSRQMWALYLLWFTPYFLEHLILQAQKNQTHFLYGILISPSISCLLSLTTFLR